MVRKRRFTGLLILFIIVMFLAGCFDGETPQSKEKKHFLGLWKGQAGPNNLSYYFREDGTYHYTIATGSTNGSWELSNDQLILTIRNNSEPFNYSFSNDYQKLTLTPVKFNFSYTVTKQ